MCACVGKDAYACVYVTICVSKKKPLPPFFVERMHILLHLTTVLFKQEQARVMAEETEGPQMVNSPSPGPISVTSSPIVVAANGIGVWTGPTRYHGSVA
jgi:hypothetical protein